MEFVKDAFRGLVAPTCHTSALDLRVGMRFEGERAQLLQGGGLQCVYSGKGLTANTLDIDHCLPWHAWPRGYFISDLWNLLPASSQLNRQKSDRVPSEVMLSGAQTRIQDWWAQAYDGVLGERFRLEAQASLLPVGGGYAPAAYG